MNRFNTISNTQLSQLIDEWIKSERDRRIMKRSLIDGICYEKIAEEVDMSPIQIYRVVKKRVKELTAICNEWTAIYG